ncbi:hypothetical protein CF326_g7657 [Tilletia indica]|nr:hypothetical protein CF326_g7657 [Tilletia indica]
MTHFSPARIDEDHHVDYGGSEVKLAAQEQQDSQRLPRSPPRPLRRDTIVFRTPEIPSRSPALSVPPVFRSPPCLSSFALTTSFISCGTDSNGVNICGGWMCDCIEANVGAKAGTELPATTRSCWSGLPYSIHAQLVKVAQASSQPRDFGLVTLSVGIFHTAVTATGYPNHSPGPAKGPIVEAGTSFPTVTGSLPNHGRGGSDQRMLESPKIGLRPHADERELGYAEEVVVVKEGSLESEAGLGGGLVQGGKILCEAVTMMEGGDDLGRLGDAATKEGVVNEGAVKEEVTEEGGVKAKEEGMQYRDVGIKKEGVELVNKEGMQCRDVECGGFGDAEEQNVPTQEVVWEQDPMVLSERSTLPSLTVLQEVDTRANVVPPQSSPSQSQLARQAVTRTAPQAPHSNGSTHDSIDTKGRTPDMHSFGSTALSQSAGTPSFRPSQALGCRVFGEQEHRTASVPVQHAAKQEEVVQERTEVDQEGVVQEGAIQMALRLSYQLPSFQIHHRYQPRCSHLQDTPVDASVATAAGTQMVVPCSIWDRTANRGATSVESDTRCAPVPFAPRPNELAKSVSSHSQVRNLPYPRASVSASSSDSKASPPSRVCSELAFACSPAVPGMLNSMTTSRIPTDDDAASRITLGSENASSEAENSMKCNWTGTKVLGCVRGHMGSVRLKDRKFCGWEDRDAATGVICASVALMLEVVDNQARLKIETTVSETQQRISSVVLHRVDLDGREQMPTDRPAKLVSMGGSQLAFVGPQSLFKLDVASFSIAHERAVGVICHPQEPHQSTGWQHQGTTDCLLSAQRNTNVVVNACSKAAHPAFGISSSALEVVEIGSFRSLLKNHLRHNPKQISTPQAPDQRRKIASADRSPLSSSLVVDWYTRGPRLQARQLTRQESSLSHGQLTVMDWCFDAVRSLGMV